MDKSKKNIYHRLIISGGGNKAIAYLAALNVLGEKRLQKIKHFIGVSGGGIMAALLALGFTTREILQQESKNGFEFCWHWLLTFPFTCFHEGGFVNIDHLRQIFINGIKRLKPGHEEWTFKDLYEKRHIILEIPALSTTTAKRVVFNVQNTPDMKIVESIVASSAIPIFFTPYRYKDDIILDGGLYVSAPWNYVDCKPFIDCDEYCCHKTNKNCTLGLVIDYETSNECVSQPKSWISLFLKFIQLPISSLSVYEFDDFEQHTNQQVQCCCKCIPKNAPKKLIKLLVDNKNYGNMFSNIFPTKQQKHQLYKSAKLQAKQQNI